MEYIEIIKDENCCLKIDILALKKMLDTFQVLETTQDDKSNILVRKIRDGEVVAENLVKSARKVEVNEKQIDEILEGCTGNVAFYRNYLKGINYLRISDDFNFIKSYLHDGLKVLEIGAVPPLLDYFMIKEGVRDLTVIDPNASEFKSFWDKAGIHYIEADIMDLRNYVQNESYDMIILSEVWEHLIVDKYSLIKNLYSILKKDGLLFLTTPNLESISGMYGLLCESSGYATKYKEGIVKQYLRYEKMGYYGHLREYTPKEIEQLFEQIDRFKLVEKKFVNQHNGGMIDTLEKMFPEYASMGKYLFRKHSDFCTLIEGKNVCIWGMGHAFFLNIAEIRKYVNIKYVIDSNAKEKQEKYSHLPCITPKDFEKVRNPFVIITLERREYREEVKNYLCERGIAYVFYDEIKLEAYQPKCPTL